MDSIIRIISAMIVFMVVFINVLGNLFGVGDLIPTQPEESSETTFIDEISTHTTAEYTTEEETATTVREETTSIPVEDDMQRVTADGKYICFGWNEERIISVLGNATETFHETTTDGKHLTTLVYASDYSKFAVYQITDGVFSGFFTVDKSAVITDGVKSYSIAYA